MTKFKACLIFILLFQYKADAQNKTSNAIDSCVLKFMREYQIPGCAIVILKDNTVARMKGYGLASLEYHVPVSIKTKFLLDSQTKLFTAMAIMKLQEEGKVKLDDPINLYLDSIPAALCGSAKNAGQESGFVGRACGPGADIPCKNWQP